MIWLIAIRLIGDYCVKGYELYNSYIPIFNNQLKPIVEHLTNNHLIQILSSWKEN